MLRRRGPGGARGRRLPQFVPKSEWEKVLRATQFEPDGVTKRRPELVALYQALVAFMLYTGARISEAVGTDLSAFYWADEALKERKVRLLGKGDKERISDVTPKLQRYLDAYLAVRRQPRGSEGEPLFVSQVGLRLSVRRAQIMVKELGTRAKVLLDPEGRTRLTPHKLRHSHATALYEASEGDLKMVQDQLGHEDPQTTAIYAQVSEPRRRKAMVKI